MRIIAVRGLPVEPGAELPAVPTWRTLPEVGSAVSVVRLDGSRARWTGRVVRVDEETGTYCVIIEGAKE